MKETLTHRRVILTAVLALLTPAVPGHAAPGDPDPTFAECGFGIADFGKHESLNGIALQLDGKIVTVGYMISSGGSPTMELLLTRWLPSGQLDPSFGVGGVAVHDLAMGSEGALSVVVKADGKIVIGGFEGPRPLIAQFTSSGALDPTFGNGGFVDSTFLTDVRDLILDSEGRIVGTGRSPTSRFVIIRLTADGHHDSTFGSQGASSAPLAGGAEAVVLQPDGDLVVAGKTSAEDGSGDNFGLARFTSSGQLDPTFGILGTVVTDLGAQEDLQDLALRPDGKLVVGGASGTKIAIAQYTAIGTLDPTFGTSGVLIDDFTDSGEVRALALRSDGSLIVAGSASLDGVSNLYVGRYTSGGTVDTTFAEDGYFLLALEPSIFQSGRIEDLALDAHGRIVAGAQLHALTEDFLLLRLQSKSPSEMTGYALDGYGGAHPFATGPDPLPPCTNSSPYFPGRDMARGAAILPDGSGGFLVDGFGGIHPFGVGLSDGPPRVSGVPYFGFDIARDLELEADGTGGYVLDGLGGIHPFTHGGNSMPVTVTAAPYFEFDIARDIVLLSDGSGGYILDGFGGVHAFGLNGSGPPTAIGVPYFGSDIARAVRLHPGGGGYVLDGYGGIHPFGGAPVTRGGPYFQGFDIARDFVLENDGSGGYLLDGYGAIHPFSVGGETLPPSAAGTPYFGFDIAESFALVP